MAETVTVPSPSFFLSAADHGGPKAARLQTAPTTGPVAKRKQSKSRNGMWLLYLLLLSSKNAQ
jgi:hypothetical protein